jgi:hypothetical protein
MAPEHELQYLCCQDSRSIRVVGVPVCMPHIGISKTNIRVRFSKMVKPGGISRKLHRIHATNLVI